MNNPTPRNIKKDFKGYQYPVSPQNIKLEVPKIVPDFNFFTAVTARRSTKKMGGIIDLQLDHLLWFSAKAFKVSFENDYLFSLRASPSAGSIHPIDIILNRPQSNILEYYNPFEHSLYPLKFDQAAVVKFLNHIAEAFPDRKGVLLWFLAHSYRTAANYVNHESLVWRDAGALVQTIQLTSVSLGLSSCPVGSLAYPHIKELLLGFDDVVSAGGIIVGNSLVI